MKLPPRNVTFFPQSSFYVFGVFVDSIGSGTTDKRIPEGLD